MSDKEIQSIVMRAEDEYERMKDRIHDLYDENKELKKEVERLKEEYMILQNASDEVEEKLQQRINKAIEYIEQQRLHKFQDTTGGLTYKERKLLGILEGVGKNEKES